MLTKEENELFTRVEPGTPVGEMLRRYWWPVGFSEEVKSRSAPMCVRLLCEDLVLFRDGQGRVGVLGLHCSHRGASLEYGRVEDAGVRCCYHGWLYDVQGRCLEQPAEPEDSTYKDRVRQLCYPAEELGGLIFAYLGPEPAPLLPRYDLLVREDGTRVLSAGEEYCNWLQRGENTFDIAHVPFLHASGYPSMAMKRPHVAWERTWYGLRVTSEIPGIATDRVTHSIFPSWSRISTARVGGRPNHDLRMRVPTDDAKTTTFSARFYAHGDGDRGQPLVVMTDGLRRSVPGVYQRVEDGYWGIASSDQDRMAQESQGVVVDRTAEHLATSDGGVVWLRTMIRESLEAIAQGKDPVGILRDPERNGCISLDASMEEIGALV